MLAVEPEPLLREAANKNAREAPVPVEVVDGVSGRLPAQDESVDAGVASLVLCSVPDQATALAEFRRVIRPEAIFASTNTSSRTSRSWPDSNAPPTRRSGHTSAGAATWHATPGPPSSRPASPSSTASGSPSPPACRSRQYRTSLKSRGDASSIGTRNRTRARRRTLPRRPRRIVVTLRSVARRGCAGDDARPRTPRGLALRRRHRRCRRT